MIQKVLGVLSPGDDSLEAEQEIWGRGEVNLDRERRLGIPWEEVEEGSWVLAEGGG